MKKIAVIGAGISGLTCAYELKKAGHDITVFEKNDYVGGRMASRTKEGYTFDIGADHLCNLYTEMRQYCDEFNIPWQPVKFLDYRLYRNGRLRNFDTAVRPLSRLRLALTYMRNKLSPAFLDMTKYAPHDTQDAYTFMKQKAGKEVADYFVDAFTSTYQFHRADEISNAALLGVMKSIVTEKRKGQTMEEGAESRKNGWYLHHMQGGMSALPEALAAQLNVQLKTPVNQIKAENGAVVVTTDKEESFDFVVLAGEAPHMKKLYQNPTAEQKAILDSTSYASSISVAFRVNKSVLPDTTIVWVPFVEDQRISGYVNESMKGEDTTQGDTTLLCAWLHEDYAKTLLAHSDDDIFTAVASALNDVCPWIDSADQLTPHDLHRWDYAMPKFYAGHLKNVADFLENGQGQQNVYFTGDYLNSPWTEGALRCGQRVAKQIISDVQ